MNLESYMPPLQNVIDCVFSEDEKINFTQSYLKLEDNRSFFKKKYDVIHSIFSEIFSRCIHSNPRLCDVAAKSVIDLTEEGAYSSKLLPWNITKDSKKLVVFIHGLKSSPLVWTKYLNEIVENQKPTTTIFAPVVKDTGCCKLKEAALPILTAVENYVEKYPDNKVILIGYSNGARVAGFVERKLNAKETRLISIAGSFKGTKLIDDLLPAPLLKNTLGIPSSLNEEWMFSSDWHEKQINKWRNRAHLESISRVFIASADDFCIYPHTSSFPSLPNSEYWLLSSASHVTIINMVQDVIVSYIDTE